MDKLKEWIIEETVQSIHELNQRLFWKVEADMCENGQPKDGYTWDEVNKVTEARKSLQEVCDLLDK